ncbi:hypothetical protein A3J20_00560 [Candidatus Gottesmanbacteria bacterium RIFCSPLOWO2_02_FULL_42_29]|nr:MAG: hypothetical protein A3J20_00560 [Candidatus Gottesmanbacteria bacterium RIFCSPLOWO2_02_FULL_42_29]
MKKSAGWNWINKMGQAWVERNPNAILTLFADKFQYFESPFTKPLSDKKTLLALWQEVPASQKDVSFEFEIISETQFRYIAHWKSSFTRIPTGKKAFLDGIFLINLNNQGLCTLFKQWWVNKEK